MDGSPHWQKSVDNLSTVVVKSEKTVICIEDKHSKKQTHLILQTQILSSYTQTHTGTV